MSSKSKTEHVPANGMGGHGWRRAYRVLEGQST